MSGFKMNDRVFHPIFGLGTVLEDESAGRLKVRFDNKGDTWLALKHAMLRPATQEDEMAMASVKFSASNTFIWEAEDAKHWLGSHWAPFFDEREEFLRHLPALLQRSQPHGGYSRFYPAPGKAFMPWFDGRVLRVPSRQVAEVMGLQPCRDVSGEQNGAAIVVRLSSAANQANELVSLFPFFPNGIEHEIEIRQVRVWKSGVEAQIDAVLGDAEITFFDTDFVNNRDWYRAGTKYQFILVGIAYSARIAEPKTIEFNHSQEMLAFLEEIAASEGEGVPTPVSKMTTQGMAALLRVPDWGHDDYSFHGTIREVTETAMLGQRAWRVRATVLRSLETDEDIDLDILVTEKVWENEMPPMVGGDMEGHLWLQGYLWAAPR